MERTKIQITDSYRCFLRILTGTAHAHTVRVKDLPFHLYLYMFGQWTESCNTTVSGTFGLGLKIASAEIMWRGEFPK